MFRNFSRLVFVVVEGRHRKTNGRLHSPRGGKRSPRRAYPSDTRDKT